MPLHSAVIVTVGQEPSSITESAKALQQVTRTLGLPSCLTDPGGRWIGEVLQIASTCWEPMETLEKNPLRDSTTYILTVRM